MQKSTIVLTDDLTGENADETVNFGLDGAHYEIDLAHGHAAKLRAGLGAFIDSARKLPGRTPARIGTKRTIEKPDTKQYRDTVRAWARQHRVPFTVHGDIKFVGERGIVPAEVYDKYERRDTRSGAPLPADLGVGATVTEPQIVHTTTTSPPATRTNTRTRRTAPAKLTRR